MKIKRRGTAILALANRNKSNSKIDLERAKSYLQKKLPPIPTFQRATQLNQHQITIDGKVFEYYGGEYYRLDASLGPGDSFGEQILQKASKINPKGYKTDNGPVELAVLSKERFVNCLQRA